MKIVFIGGHITPALATMDALQKMQPKVDFVFFGRMTAREGDRGVSVEYELVKSRKIPFYAITTGRLQRSFTIYTLISLLKIPVGFIQSLLYLLQIRPDGIVSFGGYVAVPVALAGWLLRIPVVTHEQTLVPGLANKIIARFAKVVALSFATTQSAYQGVPTELVGNPLRKEPFEPRGVFRLPFNENVVYVTGGNQGAHVINQAIFEILEALLSECTVIHQTGNSEVYKDYAQAQQMKENLPDTLKERYFPFEYVGPDLIGDVYAATSVVVGRSGINTVCEVLYLGKRAVFRPINYEQRVNAELGVKTGMAVVWEQLDERGENLKRLITEMLRKEISVEQKQQAKSLIIIDADQQLANLILKTFS